MCRQDLPPFLFKEQESADTVWDTKGYSCQPYKLRVEWKTYGKMKGAVQLN
jgi:hypothetical protein